MTMKFLKPHPKYKLLLETFKNDHGEELFLYGASGLERTPLDRWFKKIKDQEKGVNLPKGYVPSTTFLVMDQAQIIGFLNIRHYLNDKLLQSYGHVGYMVHRGYRQQGYGEKILQYAMDYAKNTLNIKSLLLACDFTNTASKALIEKCGGAITTENYTTHNAPFYQYRITLS